MDRESWHAVAHGVIGSLIELSQLSSVNDWATELNLNEVCNKEFMIWTTVSSQSCFYWLYRTPSSAAKNIINLVSVLIIWWCPCVVISCVIARGCLLWPVRSLGKSLLAFALLHFILRGQTCHASLDFLLLYSSPLWWKGHIFLVCGRISLYFSALNPGAHFSSLLINVLCSIAIWYS